MIEQLIRADAGRRGADRTCETILVPYMAFRNNQQ